MDQIDTYQIFYLNSANRFSGIGTDTQFQIQLQNYYPNNKYTHCVVKQISIPKSYYGLQSTQNTFTLSENGTQATITLTPGTYTRQSFIAVLTAALNAASPHSYTYTVNIPNTSIAPETGHFTFTVSGNGSVQPQFIFPTGSGSTIIDNPAQHMGFTPGSTVSFSANSLTSVNCISLLPVPLVYLRSNIISQKSPNWVLDLIPMANVQSFAYGTKINSTMMEAKEIEKSTLSNSIHLALTDENGIALDSLNGLPWMCELMLFNYKTVDEQQKKADQVAQQIETIRTLLKIMYLDPNEIQHPTTKEGFTLL